MADPHSAGPRGGPAVPPWNLPPLHGHQQHLTSPPLPPFRPFPPGNPGFGHGFPPAPQQYYNAGPRPFPFHGHPPNQGSFGAPPLPPLPPMPPPQRVPPQMMSGMFTVVQSPSRGGGRFMRGEMVQSEQYNGTPALEIARRDDLGSSNEPRDDLGFRKEPQEMNVIEMAILRSQEESKVDLKELVSQIRALVDQAEEAVKNVGKMIRLEPSKAESKFATCPYDASHRVSPEALFKHILCCPSNPKPRVADAQKLVSSLRYPHWQHHDDKDSGPGHEEPKTLEFADAGNHDSSFSCAENVTEGGIHVKKGNSVKDEHSVARLCTTGGAAKASLCSEIDIWGGSFFYAHSPAVVQTPLATAFPMPPEDSVAQLAVTVSADQLGPKVQSTYDAFESVSSLSSTKEIGTLSINGDGDGGGPPLLPSRLWFLHREIESWKGLPALCSTLVIQAATAVGKLNRNVLLEWVLMHGPAHGVVIDSPMASHIHSLARMCLTCLQKEASGLMDNRSDDDLAKRKIDRVGLTKVEEALTSEDLGGERGHGMNVSLIDCPHLFRSGHWLASQLSSLFGPLQSKVLVLELLKHCLLLSGRILASPFVAAFTKQQQATDGYLQLSRHLPEEEVKPTKDLQTLKDGNQLKSLDETLKVKSATLPLEVEAAIAAVHERAILESYLRTLSYPSRALKFQMIQEHEATVKMAADERLKRENYRPVLEHDGLIWHRSQLEDKTKNKTKEEMLAEERDYKRRRMSYRGKKLKRNPTEVLHDLIGGHMEEIIAAGGIGSLVKHSGGVLPSTEASGVGSGPQPGRRDDRLTAPINSKTLKQDSAHRVAGLGTQGDRYLEMEDGADRDDWSEAKHKRDDFRGDFRRQNSHRYSSDSGTDDKSFNRSRSGSGRDHRSVSRGRWTDDSVDQGEKEQSRDRSSSQRYSGSREGSNADDEGYERRSHSRESRGKSKSSY